MPRRSNIFQRIVHALYEALKPAGGTVTESAQVSELTSGTVREVDILAETEAYGIPLRIAVEVRGRLKKDDVQWIDGLVGKYRDLGINKVIAVSATGFSPAARNKGAAGGIHLLSAKDAETHDWPAEFQKLGVGLVSRSDDVDVSIRTDPSGRRDFGRDSRLSAADGTDLGSLGEFIEFIADRHRTRLTEMLRTKFLTYYKTLADLSKTLISEDAIRPPQVLYVQTTGGGRLPIVQVSVRARSTCTLAKVPVRHTEISGHLVSSAELPNPKGAPVELFAVQRSDMPGSAAVCFRAVQTSKRAGGDRQRKPGKEGQ